MPRVSERSLDFALLPLPRIASSNFHRLCFVLALLVEHHDLVVARVGVFINKIDDQTTGATDRRTGMPVSAVKLNEVTGGNPKGSDVFHTRPRVIGNVPGWRHANEPSPAGERAEALRHAAMARHFGKTHAHVRQLHYPQPRPIT